MKALGAPRASLLGLPAVELSCSDCRDLALHLSSPEQSCSPSEAWQSSELDTQTFPAGDNPGKAAQRSSHQAGFIPSKQGLANESCPGVPAGLNVQAAQKIQVVGRWLSHADAVLGSDAVCVGRINPVISSMFSNSCWSPLTSLPAFR